MVSFQVQPKKQGMSGGADSLAEGCGKGERDVADSCTDISSTARTTRLGGTTMSGPRRDVAPSVCGQNELPLLGSRVLRGSQPVIFSSQALSRASLCREIKERAVWQSV